MTNKNDLSLELTAKDNEDLGVLSSNIGEEAFEGFIDIFYTALKDGGNAELVDDNVDDITEQIKTALAQFFSNEPTEAKIEGIKTLLQFLVGLGINIDGIHNAYFKMLAYIANVKDIRDKYALTMIKAVNIWTRITVEMYRREIDAGMELVEEISVPIEQVWDKVISVPIIGRMDSNRFAVMEENVLEAVSRYSAAFVIIDVGGLQYLDSDVASHFIKMIQAINLMGTGVIMVGIGSMISISFVKLDIDLAGLRLNTFATFKQGLIYAFDQLGLTTVDRRTLK